MQIGAGILFLLLWILYFGQVLSAIDLPLAQRLGLQEQPDTIDRVYARDAAGTARWDLLSMWTLPLAGLLMLLDNSRWPHLALIGGAIYLDTGGRQAIKLMGYRREGVRVGDDQAVRLAFTVYGTFLLLGVIAIAAGLIELDPVSGGTPMSTIPVFAADHVFPQANIVAGVLVLIVGFGFHFLGQLYSVLNLEGAIKLGIQEADMPDEYRAYELGIAVADVLIGWTYAIAGVGLIADASWAYVWAWLPGVALTYHGLSHWFWTRNQRRAGYDRPFTRWPARHIWLVANLGTGLLTIAVANSQIVVT